MELSNFNVENSTELSVVNEINIDESIFTNIIDIISNAMNRLGIKLDGKSIYYHSMYSKTNNQTVKVTDAINFANSNYNNWGHFYCLDIATYSAIVLLSLIDRCSFRIN